jgi:hypothetical protein
VTYNVAVDEQEFEGKCDVDVPKVFHYPSCLELTVKS